MKLLKLLHDNAIKFGTLVIVTYALLALLYVWTNILSDGIFVKLSITYAIIISVLIFSYMVFREIDEDEKLKRNKDIN
jgi:hypothetical protein